MCSLMGPVVLTDIVARAWMSNHIHCFMWDVFTHLCLNSLPAKFCSGDINIYLHFMSLLHIDMTQVLQILPQVRPGPTYST